MQLQVSKEVSAVFERATGAAVHSGQFYIGVEHLLAAIIEKAESLPKWLQDKQLDTLHTVMREVSHTAWKGHVRVSTGDILHTVRCIAALKRAEKLAGTQDYEMASAAHLLLALFCDPNSSPSRAMVRLGLDRGKFVQSLQEGLMRNARTHAGKGASRETPRPEPKKPGTEQKHVAFLDESPQPAALAAEEDLPRLTRDLTEAARSGRLSPSVGRDKEMMEILQTLTRKTKNNVILVGEAGVGKTQVVEGLACEIATEKKGLSQLLPGTRILELNIAALMSGTQYRGALEEKLLGIIDTLKSSPSTILFIDEIHLLMGAGSTNGDSIDVANLLKPALARGEIRCIGATTFQEYRKFLEKDLALERRFQMVRVEELSEAATLEVLKRLRASLEAHHGINISSRAMEAAVRLTQRYMPNRRLPDKAIDMLDQACARYRLKVAALRTKPELLGNTVLPTAENKVTPHDIRKVVSQATSIPIEEMTAEERSHLNDLDRLIKSQLIGQEEAVNRVVSVVRKSRAGLSDPNRPLAVLLFLGPSGTGKTQLAKLLSLHLFGSMNHLITFDMSEYIEEHAVAKLLGAPPGYVGSDEEGRLTGAVKNSPFSVLLFDEIEKAHPRIFDIFLPVFDEGRLRDTKGRVVDFRNCIIILTSNIGSGLVPHMDAQEISSDLLDELRKHFRPEFINRIDEIIPFFPLLPEDIRSILKLEINAVKQRLKDKKLGIRVYQDAYDFLANRGYNSEYGARELRRTVDKFITMPVSQKILEDTFKAGDTIEVLMSGGELVFRKGELRRTTQESSGS